MTVIERIITCLREKGYRQNDLATALEKKGVAKQTITDWKSGKSKTYYELMPEIACFLSTTTNYLLTGQEPLPPDVTPDEMNLLKKLRSLSPEKRNAIENLLNQI